MSEIKIEVTHRCQLRCLHCSSVDDTPLPDMSYDDFRAIVYQMNNAHIENLTISGGEPLLWEPLLQAVEYAARPSYRKVTLYTSGYPSLSEEKARALRMLGLARIVFGVHGVDARTYDGITGIAGSCDVSTESLHAARRASLPVEVHVVPMKPNLREMEGVARVYESFGAQQVSYLRFVPHGRGKTNQAALELSCDEMTALAMHLFRTQRRFEEMSETTKIRIGTPFNILQLDDRACRQCSAGLFRATIDPDLRVYPCDAFKHITPAMTGVTEPHPSIRDHDLAWCMGKSEYFNKARLMAMSGPGATCRACNHFNACRGGCVAQKILAGLDSADPDPGCMAEREIERELALWPDNEKEG
jgi:radical SAM protein with 4Fe4S-binding SPASM domain